MWDLCEIRNDVTSLLCIVDIRFLWGIIKVWKPRRLPDHPARAERKAKYVASREIIPREVIHITLTFTFAVLGAIGSIASIVSLVLYVHDRKKK